MQTQKTILVVDDEQPLRHFMARVLESEGYRVLIAGDGLEALGLLRKLGSRVHLVVTDIAMPVMTGLELAGRLEMQTLPPAVLFVSGNHHHVQVPGPLLRKPFLLQDLTTAVRNLLVGDAPLKRQA